MGDIGNCDPNGHLAVVMGFDIAGIVVIAGIPRINRNQRHVAQVFAVTQQGSFGSSGFGNNLIREMIGNTVLVNSNQGHSTRLRRIT